MRCRRNTQLWFSGRLARGWAGDVMLSVVVTLLPLGYSLVSVEPWTCLNIPKNSEKNQRLPFNCSTDIYRQVPV